VLTNERSTKNRIQIPAACRDVIEEMGDNRCLYITPGERENTLSFYPEEFFKAKIEYLRTDLITGQDALDFEQTYLSLAHRVELDKQGRFVLPERQLSMVDLGAEVIVAGAQYRMDLWRKSDYEAFIAEAASRRAMLHRMLRGGHSATEERQGL